MLNDATHHALFGHDADGIATTGSSSQREY